MPQSRMPWRRMPDDNRIISVTLPNEPAPMRILTRRGRVASKPVVIQVAASEAPLQRPGAGADADLRAGPAAGRGRRRAWAATPWRARALEPVETMTERARSITADRLGDRLPVENPDDEMGRLATVFNETLGRLQQSFEQMRQFTSDVSHELRTPLTSIRSVGEVGLRGHPDEQGYRAIIGSMLEEVDRLAGLVDRLLTLSRAETGQAQLSREVVDLQALAENVVSHLSVLAEEKQPADRGRARRDAVGAGRPPGAAAGPRSTWWTTRSSSRRWADPVRVRAVGDAARGGLRRDRLGPRRAAGGPRAHLRSVLPLRRHRRRSAAPGWACRSPAARWKPTAAG